MTLLSTRSASLIIWARKRGFLAHTNYSPVPEATSGPSMGWLEFLAESHL